MRSPPVSEARPVICKKMACAASFACRCPSGSKDLTSCSDRRPSWSCHSHALDTLYTPISTIYCYIYTILYYRIPHTIYYVIKIRYYHKYIIITKITMIHDIVVSQGLIGALEDRHDAGLDLRVAQVYAGGHELGPVHGVLVLAQVHRRRSAFTYIAYYIGMT